LVYSWLDLNDHSTQYTDGHHYDRASTSFEISEGAVNSLLPSEQITPEQVNHLYDTQRKELFEVLDKFSSCFAEQPGFCPYVEHCINVTPDFKPKRLREYRIPELLKGEVQQHQVDELLRLGFIRPSTSPMASPVVCVLKG